MTRDPRADELLREALAAVDHCRDFYEPEDDWRDLGDAIRAYLDEPQDEAEYVWRVGSRDFYSLTTARGYAANFGGAVERAQIGPWEVVSDE